jgi:hypothetical protein
MKRILGGAFFSGVAAVLAACTHLAHRAPSTVEAPRLERDFASKAVQLSLHCVDTETPHADERNGTARPKDAHPAFYGCFDWHSAVHGHWAMLRAVDVVEGLPERDAIVATLGRHLTKENLAKELVFFRKNEGFEQPYGWGWLLRLGTELRASRLPQAKSWLRNLEPLEARLEAAMGTYLHDLKQPDREGVHGNTAFAMIHAWDYARALGKEEFRAYVERRARDLYGKDVDCALAAEPGPYDFISPCFVEADLMRRVLGPEEFRSWFAKFLPSPAVFQLKPVPPQDLTNPYQVHLVGRMYEMASAMMGVARALDATDPRRQLLLDGVKAQIDTAGPLMFQSNYGGTHWLASFAIYYYSGTGL